MRVLAVDTTGAHGSVALLDGIELAGAIGIRTARPQHAERLLATVDDLLGRLSIEAAELDGFVVAVGPGSFTGLRIGISTVEGLAYALKRPVVGVSSLDATAFRYRFHTGLIVSVIEGYRGEVYARCYASDGVDLVPGMEPVCEEPSRFVERLEEPPAVVAGTGLGRCASRIHARFGEVVRLADASFFLAEEVARLGAGRLARGEAAPLGGLEALYVRPSEAERTQRLGRPKC
ncbi:MAG TPA: tRNA (adenosine(37)-N6)-threonylcarbamoyltransferase complex dimerization subunit type 1 TsaB [Vicinamibacteria bacterium]|nr:tRNA (adenosine(37)-N6)-threonylcarbamoyltransferase complex dimerization subunit type 1 TsaB [Vicinamibacteria bacterium]